MTQWNQIRSLLRRHNSCNSGNLKRITFRICLSFKNFERFSIHQNFTRSHRPTFRSLFIRNVNHFYFALFVKMRKFFHNPKIKIESKRQKFNLKL